MKTMFNGAVCLTAYVIMVFVNALANVLPINGNTSAQVSDSFANLFAPAGFTFAIWSVIYLLLALHVAWQLGIGRPKHSSISESVRRKVAQLFIVSSALNAIWIVAWHYHAIGLSLVIIFCMLYCVGRAALLLADEKVSLKERLFTALPFSVYFGWLTVATIANFTTWLVSTGWKGGSISEEIWTVAVLCVGALIGLATTIRLRDCAYSAVLAWAYCGILAKHLPDNVWNGRYPLVIGSVASLLAILLGATVWFFYQNHLRGLLLKNK